MFLTEEEDRISPIFIPLAMRERINIKKTFFGGFPISQFSIFSSMLFACE